MSSLYYTDTERSVLKDRGPFMITTTFDPWRDVQVWRPWDQTCVPDVANQWIPAEWLGELPYEET